MPELPDVVVYAEALERHLKGRVLDRVLVLSPNLLKTWDPPLSEAQGRRVLGARRQGKQLVLELEGDLRLVLHLMIAGRLHWKKAGAAPPRKGGLAAFQSGNGTLVLVEHAKEKRASLHLVRGDEAVRRLGWGGIEPLEASLPDFAAALRRRNHTLKRALTAPDLISGIGNAYSDEILHRAKLSPAQTTAHLEDAEIRRLYDAARAVLTEWTERLRREAGTGFPEKVTAFREGMAVHGRFGRPCPDCGAPVQRIVYAANEANYCARCQTGGRLLADRAFSRLLKSDWPKRLEDLEPGA